SLKRDAERPPHGCGTSPTSWKRYRSRTLPSYSSGSGTDLSSFGPRRIGFCGGSDRIMDRDYRGVPIETKIRRQLGEVKCAETVAPEKRLPPPTGNESGGDRRIPQPGHRFHLVRDGIRVTVREQLLD